MKRMIFMNGNIFSVLFYDIITIAIKHTNITCTNHVWNCKKNLVIVGSVEIKITSIRNITDKIIDIILRNSYANNLWNNSLGRSDISIIRSIRTVGCRYEEIPRSFKLISLMVNEATVYPLCKSTVKKVLRGMTAHGISWLPKCLQVGRHSAAIILTDSKSEPSGKASSPGDSSYECFHTSL